MELPGKILTKRPRHWLTILCRNCGKACRWHGKSVGWTRSIRTREALDNNPRFAPAFINRGLAYMALNEPTKAVHDFNQAIRLDSKNAATYFKRGVAYSQMGQYQDAADSYTQAIRLDPKYAEAYFNRSLANRSLGDTSQAEKDRAAAVKINPQLDKQSTSAG